MPSDDTPYLKLRSTGRSLSATPVHLTLQSINVLYGLNGTGKTTILRALEQAVRGVRDRFDTLVFVGPNTISGFGRWLSPVLSEALPLDERLLVNAGLIGSRYEQPEPEDLAFAKALIREECMAVRPIGREGLPRWEVWLCFDPRQSGILRTEWEQSCYAVRALRNMVASADQRDVAIALNECALMPLVRAAVESSGGEMRELLDETALPFTRLFPDDDLPVAGARIGELEEKFPAVPITGYATSANMDRPSDRQSRLLESFHRAAASASIDRVVAPDGESISSELLEWGRSIEQSANAIYRSLLLDAPPLKLEWFPVATWLWNPPCRWLAEDRDLSELSHAQGRWAGFAIELAGAESVDKLRLIILDEPEAALHRLAEAHTARGLKLLSDRKAMVVAATHSPALLNLQDANVIHVARTPPWTETHLLDATGRESLSELGMSPSDLLGQLRNIVLVEGRHDEIVLEGLIGERLQASRSELLVLRGGSKLKHLAESAFLFKFTDARVVVVLDNLDYRHVKKIWDGALTIARLRTADEAIAHVINGLPGRVNGESRAENIFLREFLSAALKLGRGDRIFPVGLTEPDIQHYLPVEHFVPGRTWSSLYAEYQSINKDDATRGSYKNYKDWLEKTFNASFSDNDFHRAVSAVTQIPGDIAAVAALCEK